MATVAEKKTETAPLTKAQISGGVGRQDVNNGDNLSPKMLPNYTKAEHYILPL